MPLIRISEFAHKEMKAEIKMRKASGERPIPTAESITDEMMRLRIKKRNQWADAARQYSRARS